MIQTTSPTLMDRSRLVSLLTELSDTKLNSADYNLAERMGNLMGLSGSINLAHALRQTPTGQDHRGSVSENLQELVLEARAAMILKISRSFDHKDNESKNKEANITQSSNRVPTANVAIKPEALISYEPYKRFYTTYQVEIGVEAQRLRAMVRGDISNVSVTLGRLAELDNTLEHSLAVHNRKLFEVTPRLLEKRFYFLLKSYQQADNSSELSDWLKPGAWLTLFYRDLRELLLAEFDVRLQPVFGLLEAVNEQNKIT